MTKKIIAVLLVAVMALSFAACSGTGDSKKPAVTAPLGATGVDSQEALDLKALLPEYEFNAVNEELFNEDGNSYELYVEGDAEDYAKYTKLAEKAGFTDNLISNDAENCFSKRNSDGIELDISFSPDNNEIVIFIYRTA